MSPEDALRSALGGLRRPLIVVGVLVALFMLVPILIIVPTSFTASEFLGFPPEGLSLRWYEEIFTDPTWRDVFLASMKSAAVAAAIATVVGTLAALGLRRVRVGERALRSLFIAPIVLPTVVFALGLYNVFDALRAMGGTWPIIAGQSVLAIPIVFVSVSAGLAQIDPALSRTASSLGARWPTVVWRVELPLLRGSIVAAALFAFAFCFDEVVIAYFLNGPDNTTLPVELFVETRDSISPAIAAASTVVMLIALMLVAAAGLAMRLLKPTRRTTP
jgi:putative spermidine/putrescine transport system permease protein